MTYEEAKDKAAEELGFKPYIASWAYREWMAKSAELYARSKWDEACEAQKGLCDAELLELSGIHSEAPKPKFKP